MAPACARPAGAARPRDLKTGDGFGYVRPKSAKVATGNRQMAGHSQFKNIMHRKGRQDKERSKAFAKLSEISLEEPGKTGREVN